ncbi:Ig-like domain-containing protein, partial [Yokenella regensburgei]|uniref:Ig-like domain-containing protein n=1 Tax=Yokenella regensburgei TaxID=158877 RepID=UPI00192A2B41
DKAGVTATAAGVTDAGGQTTVTLTSSTTAVANITVSAQAGSTASVNADKTVSFIAGTPAQAQSTIVTDKNGYVSGDDMLVTVTLKDANGNGVTGVSASLTAEAVTVPNATAKADGWTDNGYGTYGRTYAAVTAGTGLKATVKLEGWSGAATSGAYAITADASTAKVDTVTLVGTDISKVADGKSAFDYTVTVVDANGNPVSGATVTPKADKAGVTATAAGVTDAGGQTTVTLTSSTTAVADITVSAQAGDTAAVNADKTVSFIAGTPAQAQSTIVTDKNGYVSGDDMLVTVTLKDANGNGVTGASASLTAEAVTVPNATAKADGWTDNGDGTYGRTYAAVTAGTGLKTTVKLSGWDKAAQSDAYAITAPPELKDITVNGYTFAKDAGFPTTGFTGATFTLNLTAGAASDYTWTSDADWVSVTNGVVKFTKKGTGSKVTITGKRKSGGSVVINYSFTLKDWFIRSGTGAMTNAEASTSCSSQSYSLPTVAQLSNAKVMDMGSRALGPLWSEWGHMRAYPDSGISNGPFWTSEWGGENQSYYYVYMDYGRPAFNLSGTVAHALTLCRQGF